MKQICFVVDGNWYLHRVWFTLRTSRPVEEVLPHNFVSLIMKDACAVKATHILIGFDGPNVFRHKIFPDYKGNRDKDKEQTKGNVGDDGEEGEEGGREIYSYLPAVRAYLEMAGLTWIQPRIYEADDVFSSASHQYGALPNTKVVGGARDKDSYQSLRPNVVGYDSAADPPHYITMAYAEKSKGVRVSQMVMYQTLIGDKIDNIPTLLPPAAAKKVIHRWGSFKAWFAGGTREDKVWLRANQVKLALNKRLVEMVKDLSLPELDALRMAKKERLNMPKSWYAYRDFLYPKSKGLFRR